MTMVKTTAGSDNSETEPRADGQRNQFGRPEAQGLELKTALEICTELRTPELRRKFSGLVTGGGEERRQVCALDLYDLMELLPNRYGA